MDKRNLEVGDIMLLKYEKALGSSKYRLARISQVHPDKHGKVRTVTIRLRNLRKARAESATNNRAGTTEMIVAVQRLVVILPIGEEWNGGLSGNHQ